MSTTLTPELSQSEVDEIFDNVTGGLLDVVPFSGQLPDFQHTTATKNIEMLIQYGFSEKSISYLGRQIFTGINENTDGKAEPYTLERNERGQVVVDELGRLALAQAQSFIDEIAQPAVNANPRAQVLMEHGTAYVEAARSVDSISLRDEVVGVLAITAAPHEAEIEALNSGELGGEVQYNFENKKHVAIYFEEDRATPMFIYGEEVASLTERARDMASTRAGTVIYEGEEGTSGKSMVIEFGTQDSFDIDLVAEFTKYMKTNLDTDVNIRNSPEAMAYIEELSELTLRLAKEAHCEKRASDETRELALELLRTRRSDSTSYVPEKHIPWVEELIDNPNMEFTSDMAALFAYMQEYSAWINIKYLVGDDVEFNKKIEAQLLAAGGAGGHNIAAAVVDEIPMPDCPGSIKGSLTNSQKAEMANMSFLERRRYLQDLERKMGLTKRESSRGVCRANSRGGCESNVSESDRNSYQEAMYKIGEIQRKMDEGEKVVLGKTRIFLNRRKEQRALKAMDETTDVYECGFCLECEKWQKRTGADLGQFVAA